jgi:drug/metabolite transporter (DMT)-like permease
MSKLSKGLFFSFSAYTLWATGDMFVKLATEKGASPVNASATISLLSALVLFARAHAKKLPLWPARPAPVLLRAVFNLIASIGFYTAYAHLPLTSAYALEFTTPFLIMLGAWLFLGEGLGARQIGCVALAFLGGLVALDPAHLLDDPGNLAGYMGIFVAIIGFTATQLINRHLAERTAPETIMFLTSVLGGLFCALASGRALFSLPSVCYALLAAGTCTSLSGGYLIIFAAKHIKAGLVSAFHYWQFVPAALFGWLIWHQAPTPPALAGSAIIVAAAALLGWTSRKRA